jgi:hypothetical protein
VRENLTSVRHMQRCVESVNLRRWTNGSKLPI